MNKEKRYYNLTENINRTANKNNKLLDEIKEDIESDPILDIFRKRKGRHKKVFILLLTFIIMLCLAYLITFLLDSNDSLGDKMFEVLGNGFFLGFGAYLYIYLSNVFFKNNKGSDFNAKNKTK